MLNFDAVMFDLDGTLVDTLADIANVGNYTLAKLGQPIHEIDAYRYLAGQGARWLVEHALEPDQQHLVEEGFEILKAYQLEHGMDLAEPYDGIPQMLDELTNRGLKKAVLSNKPDHATQDMIRIKCDRWSFDAVWGHKEEFPLKPDATSAIAVAEEVGVEPSRWLYLGDTKIDMETANGAGFHAVGVLWGFRDEQELRDSGARTIISHPMELIDLL